MKNESKDDRSTVIQGCVQSCGRLLQVANAVTSTQYQHRWKAHNAIGPHMRHCYEHLIALMEGLPSGTIDYDARSREVTLEEDPLSFAQAMKPVLAWLDSLAPELLDTPLTISQIPQVDKEKIQSTSTLQRELLFLTSHSIHHLALVTVLAEVQGVTLPLEFGIAYSTTTHEHQLREKATRSVAATP